MINGKWYVVFDADDPHKLEGNFEVYHELAATNLMEALKEAAKVLPTIIPTVQQGPFKGVTYCQRINRMTNMPAHWNPRVRFEQSVKVPGIE